MNARRFDRLAAHGGRGRVTEHKPLRAWLWLLLWAAVAAAAGSLLAYTESRRGTGGAWLSGALEHRVNRSSE